MAPRRTRRATRKKHRHPKAVQQISRREEGSPDSTPDNSSSATVVAISSDENHINILGDSSGEADNIITNNYSSGCSTPKGKRYRIPEIQTCPPAPKKRRVVSNCTLKRSSPVAFFAPPDVELFFFFALRGISQKEVTHSTRMRI